MTTTRATWRGVTVDTRTAAMLAEVARLTPGLPALRPTQGSFNRGGVAQSAGTHDGAGAVDFSTSGLLEGQKQAYVAALRRVGFAAWIRRAIPGHWGEHMHAIAVGEPDASQGAKLQVRDYLNGLNGLATRGRDDGPRDHVGQTWETYQQSRPVAEEEKDDMAGSDVWLIQADDTAIAVMRADGTRKVKVGTPQVLDDFLHVIAAGGGKILSPPEGTPVHQWHTGHQIWRVSRDFYDTVPG